MLFIASCQGYTAGTDSFLDASSTLNILAGDLLILITNPDLGSNTLDWMGEDDEATNGLTILASTAGTFEVTTGYLLSASASSGATMRVTLSGGANTAGWEFTCLQFRPEAGESVGFGSGPASNNSGFGSNPVSGQLSTAFTDSLFVGGAFNDRQTLSNHQIGGAAVDAVITGTADFDVAYTIFGTTQSNITYSTSSSSGVWAAQMVCIEITISGGTTYNESITEAANPTDSFLASLSFNLISSDTASAFDSYSGLIDMLASLSDTANPSDIYSAGAAILDLSFSDTANPSDDYSATYIFNITLDDTATPSDIFDSIAEYGVDVSEIAAAFDSYSSGELIEGRMCVTISGVRADINITAISGQINITAVRPGIDMTGEGCE